MADSRTRSAAGLGLCEHCNCLISMEDLPADAMNTPWSCPKCNGNLSHLSFGYDRAEQGAQKVNWVGPDCRWTNTEPKTDYMIAGSICVTVGKPLTPL